jgi:hypothetical protein
MLSHKHRFVSLHCHYREPIRECHKSSQVMSCRTATGSCQQSHVVQDTSQLKTSLQCHSAALKYAHSCTCHAQSARYIAYTFDDNRSFVYFWTIHPAYSPHAAPVRLPFVWAAEAPRENNAKVETAVRVCCQCKSSVYNTPEFSNSCQDGDMLEEC